jgi:hypothetical protein
MRRASPLPCHVPARGRGARARGRTAGRRLRPDAGTRSAPSSRPGRCRRPTRSARGPGIGAAAVAGAGARTRLPPSSCSATSVTAAGSASSLALQCRRSKLAATKGLQLRPQAPRPVVGLWRKRRAPSRASSSASPTLARLSSTSAGSGRRSRLPAPAAFMASRRRHVQLVSSLSPPFFRRLEPFPAAPRGNCCKATAKSPRRSRETGSLQRSRGHAGDSNDHQEVHRGP